MARGGPGVTGDVAFEPRSIDRYRDCAGDGVVERLRHAAAPLRGMRVLHVNSTRRGGGVAEILQSAVPLLRGLGLECDWWVMDGSPEFFQVTKHLHNRLQGGDGRMEPREARVWRETQVAAAASLPDGYDLVVVHDPQPAGLPTFAPAAAAHWVWRLHIDSSHPDPGAWEVLRGYLEPYEALVVTMPEFAPPEVPAGRVRVEAPAIDPLRPKNQVLAADTARPLVAALGIDLSRQLLAQVARLDPWKDPMGVIDAFRLVRRGRPGLQLALLGAIEAVDDPGAERLARDVRAYAGGDPDIHVFTDPAVIGPTQVGAVQLVADVVFQKSLREGFGLTVSEALWKGTPVIGGRAGGIPLQLRDGEGGFLVSSVEEAADRCGWLLDNPGQARSMGEVGRSAVAARFLVTRLLEDELALYADIVAGRVTEEAPGSERPSEPARQPFAEAVA
jgi:trehalose synthase